MTVLGLPLYLCVFWVLQLVGLLSLCLSRLVNWHHHRRCQVLFFASFLALGLVAIVFLAADSDIGLQGCPTLALMTIGSTLDLKPR